MDSDGETHTEDSNASEGESADESMPRKRRREKVSIPEDAHAGKWPGPPPNQSVSNKRCCPILFEHSSWIQDGE